MKVSILGTGDITKIARHTKLSQQDIQNLIGAIGKLLAQKKAEIVIVPDRGIPYEIAKIYKDSGGKKVYGMVPVKDKKFGIEHIKPYLGVIDERIPMDSWYAVNGEIAASGDVCVILGISPGVIIELGFLKYHYRYFKSQTKLVIFRNTLSSSLPREIEEEIKDKIVYISSIKELEDILNKWPN